MLRYEVGRRTRFALGWTLCFAFYGGVFFSPFTTYGYFTPLHKGGRTLFSVVGGSTKRLVPSWTDRRHFSQSRLVCHSCLAVSENYLVRTVLRPLEFLVL